MRLSDLQARGAFVDSAPVKRTIDWTHQDPQTGKVVTDKCDIFIVRPSFGMIEKFASANQGSPIDAKRSAVIAACIRLGDDASEQMTYDQACTLDPALAAAMEAAIYESGAVVKKRNPSPRSKSTGTN